MSIAKINVIVVPMIQIKNIAKEFAERVLFYDVSFNLNPSEKIGLVGRNGSGKSTLFKMILGELTPDEGSIEIPKNYTIGHLAQHIHFTHPSVIAECMSVLSEEEKFDNFKAEKILSGLGFKEEDFLKDPKTFSGGYQVRINLTKALLQNPNLLLLDEPTNYLDVVSIRWLERFLKTYDGEIILITHDRTFMNAVCNATMGIHRQKLVKIQGNFEKYKEKIEVEEKVYENTRLNQEKKRKEIEDFITKFKAKASKATQAQSRMKMLEKMEEYEKLADINNLDFSFSYKDCPSKHLMNIRDVAFGYTQDKILFRNLSFDIEKGDRIAVIGKNGKGKSTLLTLLNTENKPLAGDIQGHPSLSIGYFGQTNIERLHPSNSIEEEIAAENSELTNTRIRGICGTMMFSGDDAKKKISVLSGGEKSRVLLGKILAHPSNLLLLDEPTNHLDQESIEALGNQIHRFEGAVVIVTHNEALLRLMAKKIIVFHKDTCEIFNGSYDEFLEKIGWEEEKSDDISTKVKPSISYKDLKRERAELIKRRADETRELKKIVEKLEKNIVDLEAEQTTLQENLIQESSTQNGVEISRISTRLAQVEKQIDEDFEALEINSNELHEIEKKYQEKLEGLL